MTREDYAEIDAALESVYVTALESHTIDTKTRNELPDDCFAIIGTDENGNKKRSYPIRVPGDRKKTEELVIKAVQFFHYSKPEDKAKLAKAIMDTISKENIEIRIGKRSQIFRHIDMDKVPASVTVVEKE